MGLLTAALGGMAEVGLKQAEDQRQSDMEQARAERMAELNSKLIQQRTEAVEATRRRLDAEQREATQRRLAEQSGIVETEAAERRTKREIDTANEVAPSVDGAVGEFLKSTQPPDKREKVYGVNAPSAVSELDDQIAVARKHGFYEQANALRSDRRYAMAELNTNRREDDREKRTLLIEQRDEGNRIAADKRIERMLQGGGSNEPSFVATYKFLETKGYSKERIEEILTQKKAMSAAELAAKLAGKPTGKDRPERPSLEGEGTYMDSEGNIRKTGGELVRPATPRNPAVTQFNERMVQEAALKKAQSEEGILDRLRRSFGGEPEKRK